MGKMCQCGGNGDRSKINDIAKCKVESTVRVGIRGKKWNDRSDNRGINECNSEGNQEE